jgi:hypothetical protein
VAAKKVSLKVPSAIEVGNVDVEFEVRDGTNLMGTVAISRGGIDWRPKGKHRANSVSVTWTQFAALMTPEKAPPARTRAASSAARTRARRPAATAVDDAAIRDWARKEGRPVHARGALAKDLKDAYYAAHAREG